jgi:hypothetical protein
MPSLPPSALSDSIIAGEQKANKDALYPEELTRNSSDPESEYYGLYI